ncbi:hypothetical protein HDU87_001684 [Geranomyces variabilis]|uniref:Uncharacterized protein n=1 Tax=Geranomyces variabilis TaxID=109894 RepID=A0AAD5TBH8_9FUNG|nr:hypothetical protein HDU87_001684 [Geranomyces variabilis]
MSHRSPSLLALWRTQALPYSPPFTLERDDLVNLLGPPLADDDIVPPNACIIAWFSSFVPHLRNARSTVEQVTKGKTYQTARAAVILGQEEDADKQLRWGLMVTSEEPMCLMCGIEP